MGDYQYQITIIAISLTHSNAAFSFASLAFGPGSFRFGLAKGDARKNRGWNSRLKRFHVASDEVYLETLLNCNVEYFVFYSNRPISIPLFIVPLPRMGHCRSRQQR